MSQVSLTRTEQDSWAMKWLSVKWVTVCCRGPSESGLGLREISVFSALKEAHPRNKSSAWNFRQSSIPPGLLSDPGEPGMITRLSFVTVFQLKPSAAFLTHLFLEIA